MTHFRVDKRDSGSRLDKFLLFKSKGFSRGKIKDLIDSGRVKVNGKRVVIAKWEMIEGDDVELRLEGWSPKERTEAKKERGERMFAQEKKKAYIKEIYSDRDILVVEKPAGMVIQAGSKRTGEETYVDQLRSYLKRKHKGKGAYVKPVHRLDKETSGLMVFAASRVGEHLIDQFKKHSVGRSYLAIAEGAVEKEEGQVDFPIKKGDFGHGKRAKIGNKKEGSRALTLYHVKERYKNATLLRLDLKTGRTHQARVHLAAIDHPIVGDRVYGKIKGLKFGRQALHSHVLSFKHPRTGKKMRFESKLPEDMASLVDELRGV